MYVLLNVVYNNILCRTRTRACAPHSALDNFVDSPMWPRLDYYNLCQADRWRSISNQQHQTSFRMKNQNLHKWWCSLYLIIVGNILHAQENKHVSLGKQKLELQYVKIQLHRQCVQIKSTHYMGSVPTPPSFMLALRRTSRATCRFCSRRAPQRPALERPRPRRGEERKRKATCVMKNPNFWFGSEPLLWRVQSG